MKKKSLIAVFLLTFAFSSLSFSTETPVYDKNDVNSFDRLIMNPYNEKLDIAGDIAVVATLAAPLVLTATPKDQWLTEVTMYSEACLFSYGLKCIGKALVNRPRPYMYFPNAPASQIADGDYLCSWPSAHSTMAFTSAAYTSYVFCKYFPESPWRFAVIGTSYAAATTVAALRLASGNHFLTDVITGAAIGTLSGFLVPYLHTFGYVEASPFGLLIKINF